MNKNELRNGVCHPAMAAGIVFAHRNPPSMGLADAMESAMTPDSNAAELVREAPQDQATGLRPPREPEQSAVDGGTSMTEVTISFAGAPGSGKSMLAACVVKPALIAAGIGYRFHHANDTIVALIPPGKLAEIATR